MSPTPHHERRWLILAVIGDRAADGRARRDDREHRAALAQQDLGFSDDQRQWIITAYALAFGSLLLLGGRLGDLFGRKWTFIGGLLGFAAASARRRRGGLVRRARRRPRRAGRSSARCSRRRALVAAGDDLHRAARARQGVRHLRRDRRRRRRRRAAARRRSLTECARLALVPVREPAVRRPGRDRRRCGCSSTQAARERPKLDLPGTAASRRRPVRARLRLLELRDALAGATR